VLYICKSKIQIYISKREGTINLFFENSEPVMSCKIFDKIQLSHPGKPLDKAFHQRFLVKTDLKDQTAARQKPVSCLGKNHPDGIQAVNSPIQRLAGLMIPDFRG
jgi:hypothetical protein